MNPHLKSLGRRGPGRQISRYKCPEWGNGHGWIPVHLWEHLLLALHCDPGMPLGPEGYKSFCVLLQVASCFLKKIFFFFFPFSCAVWIIFPNPRVPGFCRCGLCSRLSLICHSPCLLFVLRCPSPLMGKWHGPLPSSSRWLTFWAHAWSTLHLHMCILGCGVLWWITNVSTWLGGCTRASITISFSESWWELIRHLPPPRKAVGLLSKVKDEASGLWTKIGPASSPFDFPLKPGAQKKSFYLVVIMGQMRLLKCISEITSLNRTIKIIKRKHSFFFPQLSKNSFHWRNHFASGSACFRTAVLSPLQVFQKFLSWKHLQRWG